MCHFAILSDQRREASKGVIFGLVVLRQVCFHGRTTTLVSTSAASIVQDDTRLFFVDVFLLQFVNMLLTIHFDASYKIYIYLFTHFGKLPYIKVPNLQMSRFSGGFFFHLLSRQEAK